MVRNDIPAYTDTQTHPSSCNMARVPDRPAPMGFLAINRLSSCPQITTTVDRRRWCAADTDDLKILKLRHFSHFLKAAVSLAIPSRSEVSWHQSLKCLLIRVQHNRQAASTGSWEQSRECKPMRRGSIQTRCVCAAGTCGWRSVSRSHTGTSSLQSGSAGGRAGWSDQRRPGYSVDMQKVAHLMTKEKKTVSFSNNSSLTDQKACPLLIVFPVIYR